MDKAHFIRANTAIAAPPLVPELRLHLATEITPLWQATEAVLEQGALPPPYWAFAWAGGQALARYLLDRPALVAGKRALDFGAGSGLVAIAAAKCGAAQVVAAETDPFAGAAIRLNAALNGVAVAIAERDLLDVAPEAEIILAGDMCYERPLAERLAAWLGRAAAQGGLVLLGDPGRAYLPKDGLSELARYTVPTPLELEDRTSREAAVWRMAGPPAR